MGWIRKEGKEASTALFPSRPAQIDIGVLKHHKVGYAPRIVCVRKLLSLAFKQGKQTKTFSLLICE